MINLSLQWNTQLTCVGEGISEFCTVTQTFKIYMRFWSHWIAPAAEPNGTIDCNGVPSPLPPLPPQPHLLHLRFFLMSIKQNENKLLTLNYLNRVTSSSFLKSFVSSSSMQLNVWMLLNPKKQVTFNLGSKICYVSVSSFGYFIVKLKRYW